MQKANTIKSIPVHKASQCPNKRYMLATMKTNCSQKATKRIKMTFIQKSTRLPRFVLSCINPILHGKYNFYMAI